MGPVLDNERADAGMANSAAGWYDDPWNAQAKRYWDGMRWTEHSSSATNTVPQSQAQPTTRAGFVGWITRHPKAAFWSTLSVALFVGVGIGAGTAEQPSNTSAASDTSGEVESLSGQLADARDDVAGLKEDLAAARDEVETAQDKLASTRDRLRTARKKASEPVAVAPAAPAESGSSSSSSGKSFSGKSFSGNGSKNLGTIVVDEESVLEWTNDDALFIVNDQDYGLSVSSDATSGDTVLQPGTYKNVEVTAMGNWTIEVRSR